MTTAGPLETADINGTDLFYNISQYLFRDLDASTERVSRLLVALRSAVRPESRLESAELFATISALPDDFRDALIAIDVVGLSYREAARALKVREATITTRLHRARQRVAAALVEADQPKGSRRN